MRGCRDEPLFQGWPLGTSTLTGKRRRLVCQERGHCGHVHVRREGTGRRRREGRGADGFLLVPEDAHPRPVSAVHTRPGGLYPSHRTHPQRRNLDVACSKRLSSVVLPRLLRGGRGFLLLPCREDTCRVRVHVPLPPGVLNMR